MSEVVVDDGVVDGDGDLPGDHRGVLLSLQLSSLADLAPPSPHPQICAEQGVR